MVSYFFTKGGLAQLVERSLSIMSNLRKVACSTHAVSTLLFAHRMFILPFFVHCDMVFLLVNIFRTKREQAYVGEFDTQEWSSFLIVLFSSSSFLCTCIESAESRGVEGSKRGTRKSVCHMIICVVL